MMMLETLSLKRNPKNGSFKRFSRLDMVDKPQKSTIEGVEKKIVKKRKSGKNPAAQDGGCKITGGEAALTTNPEKGHSDKQTIINVDRPSDALTLDKKINNVHDPG